MEYILVFVKTDREIREKRYLLREDSDKNIFDKLDKYQINTSHSIKISDYIINDDNMDELVTNFNQLYKYLKMNSLSDNQVTIYEEPVHEKVRKFLKLEYLFDRIVYFKNKEDQERTIMPYQH